MVNAISSFRNLHIYNLYLQSTKPENIVCGCSKSNKLFIVLEVFSIISARRLPAP